MERGECIAVLYKRRVMVPMRYMGACTRIKERNPIAELFLKRWHKVLAKVYRYDNI